MKNKTIRLFALLLVLVMCFSVLSACTDKAEEAVESSEPAETEKVEETEEPKSTTPLVVGYDDFSEKFSPFFADSGYDQDVVEMTQVSLLTTDRLVVSFTMLSKVKQSLTMVLTIYTKVLQT